MILEYRTKRPGRCYALHVGKCSIRRIRSGVSKKTPNAVGYRFFVLGGETYVRAKDKPQPTYVVSLYLMNLEFRFVTSYIDPLIDSGRDNKSKWIFKWGKL